MASPGRRPRVDGAMRAAAWIALGAVATLTAAALAVALFVLAPGCGF